MPQQIGNASIRAVAWVERIMLSRGPQVERAKEMEKFTKRIRSLFGPGESLDMTTRERMEDFLGYDLEKVRIHRGREAEEASRQLSARAFTLKGHIFAPRQNLDTSTREGLGLLAHELTHTIQQTRPQRLPQNKAANYEVSSPPPISVGRSDVGMFLLAPANAPSTSRVQLREAQAQASEQLAGEALTDNKSASSPEIDPVAVADKVYRLMQCDLILERERANRVGG